MLLTVILFLRLRLIALSVGVAQQWVEPAWIGVDDEVRGRGVRWGVERWESEMGGGEEGGIGGEEGGIGGEGVGIGGEGVGIGGEGGEVGLPHLENIGMSKYNDHSPQSHLLTAATPPPPPPPYQPWPPIPQLINHAPPPPPFNHGPPYKPWPHLPTKSVMALHR